jgi:hypothetical protein
MIGDNGEKVDDFDTVSPTLLVPVDRLLILYCVVFVEDSSVEAAEVPGSSSQRQHQGMHG